MARLPDSLNLAAPRGAAPSADAVAPTDFGLGAAGSQLSAGVRDLRDAQDAADKQAAAPAFQTFLQSDAPATLAARAAYSPEDGPGFAAQQGSARADRLAAFKSSDAYTGLSAGQRTQLDHQLTAYQAQTGTQDAELEGQVLAGPIAQATQARLAAQQGSGLALYLQKSAEMESAAKSQFDGSQAGLGQALVNAHDVSAQLALAAVPDAVRPSLQLQLQAIRAQKVSAAAATDLNTTQAFVLKHASDNLDAGNNAIVSDPSQYYAWVDHGLSAAIATLPPAQRTPALEAARAQAATARVKGLILADQPGVAAQEIKAGKYDDDLSPEQKEALATQAQNALEDRTPHTVEQALADVQLRQQGDAYVDATGRTGQAPGDVDHLEAQLETALGPKAAAEFRLKVKAATSAHAAISAVAGMSSADLAHAASAPAPTDGDAANLTKWQLTSQAAQAELAARQKDPGAWAWATARTLQKGKGGLGALSLGDRGAGLQAAWQAFAAAGPGAAQAQAGSTYASQMLGAQESRQIPQSAWAIIPQDTAHGLATTVANAPPEQRAAALMNLGRLVSALPAQVRTQSNTQVSTRQLMLSQLQRAGLTPADTAAIVDFADKPVAMQRYVSAALDPSLHKALPDGGQKDLTAQVTAALSPYLATQRLQPGQEPLTQARIDRTTIVARSLMATQGLSLGAAAKAAASDLTGDRRFGGTWSMPTALANAPATANFLDTRDTFHGVQYGAAATIRDITDHGGAGLLGGHTAAGSATAQAVHDHATWINTADGSGLQLVMPQPGGSTPVLTQWGEPVRASWGQLISRSGLGAKPLYGPNRPAPPTAYKPPDGAPVPAATQSQALSALVRSTAVQESGGHVGLTSPKGAVGPYQLMPGTIAQYAPRLGLPTDPAHYLNNVPDSQRLATAIHADNLQRFGSYALAAIAYNAGPGVLTGYHQGGTWHPGLLSTVGDPRQPGGPSYETLISHLPAETQGYVRPVLARTVSYLR